MTDFETLKTLSYLFFNERFCDSGKRKVTGGRKKKIHDLTLNRLIILLNIALQWCKQTVTVGDLIHLIQQGDFPYIGT